MKFEYRIFLASAAFLTVLSVGYWYWSHESTGATMLGIGSMAWTMLCVYLALQARRLGRLRPEDRDDAGMEEAAGEVAWFPGASIWPLALGAGLVLVANGFVFGPWFAAVGVLLTGAAAAGFAAEAQSRR
jgi:hypothetical protein